MRAPVEDIGRATEVLEIGVGEKEKEQELSPAKSEVEKSRPELLNRSGCQGISWYRVGSLRCPILDAAPKRCSVHATLKGSRCVLNKWFKINGLRF